MTKKDITVAEFACERDGLTIRGKKFRNPDLVNQPAVILCHGFLADQTTLEFEAMQLAIWGFAAFTFDFCGGGLHTKSDGDTRDMSVLSEVEDLKQVLSFVKAQEYVRGGGVTFSGGEPTAQPEFLKEMLVLAKQSGLHTAVETCGYVRTDILLDLAGYVDLFLFDYKETDPGLHKKYTGRDNALIIENLSALNEAGAEIILRCPLIPGLNTDDAHMKGIADTADRLSSVKEIQLEPYHPLGISKAGAIGIAPAYENAEFMDKTLAEECRDKISKLTLKPVRIM